MSLKLGKPFFCDSFRDFKIPYNEFSLNGEKFVILHINVRTDNLHIVQL